MIVNNLSGLGIVDMQGTLGLVNDSCLGLVEKDPSKTPRLRIHDIDREHAGAPVVVDGAITVILLKSGRSTMLAGKRLAKVEENISHLISAETVRHGGHMRDPKRESSETNVV